MLLFFVIRDNIYCFNNQIKYERNRRYPSIFLGVIVFFHKKRNRTVAATKMNATSSRAHTIITVEFIQIQKIGDKKT